MVSVGCAEGIVITGCMYFNKQVEWELVLQPCVAFWIWNKSYDRLETDDL